ncbi:MAG TPA: response regulator [Kofleriaceae bacterium]|nr:response regulator [Kofleriaceae bacterium]
MGERRVIRSVLAVDDDEQILGGYRRGFGKERTVLTTADPATARQIARRERCELAIVDLRLKGESGISLTRDLKVDVPEMLIVLCSGYLSVEVAVAAVHAGADAVLFKPITARDILRRVEEGTVVEPDLEDTPTLARAEWEHITRVLADCNGNISLAARRLGIYRSSLQRRLRKFAPRQ